MAVVAILIWVFTGLNDYSMLPSLGMMIVAAYFMVELNNSFSLIRIYSRMVSCSFIVLTTAAMPLFKDLHVPVVTLCLVLFYMFSFQCYQGQTRSVPGKIFMAFVFMSLASVFWSQVLYFVPVMWILITFNLQTMSARAFVASLLGLLLPYWFLAGYYAATGQMQIFADHFIQLATFQPLLHYESLGAGHVAVLLFFVLAALLGGTHFMLTSFNDRIRTRMFYYIFITTDMLALVFLLLQPVHFNMLIGVMAVNTSPLIGHFIALTRSKLTNIITIALMVIALLLVFYNVWLPSMTF